MQFFYLWYILILCSFFFILFGYLRYSNKKDTINNILGFGAIFFVLIHVLIFLLLMFQDSFLRSDLLFLWCLTLGLPIFFIIVVVVVFSFIVLLYRYATRSRISPKIKKKDKAKEVSKARKDTYRKIPHVLIFLALFFLWYIGIVAINNASGTTEGMIPYENNTLLLYLTILTVPRSIRDVMFELGWFYYLLFFFFYIFFLVIYTNEYTRKSKLLSFPFNKVATSVLEEEESKSYGTYLYFTAGHMLAAFICPPMVLFAILGTSSIADLMSSQIGIRYGSRRISWNSKKTWEGTIAGTITCCIITFFFMGIIWALIFAFVFMIIDIFTVKPIKASDNLLIPIGLGLAYILLRFFFNLDYSTIILAFI